MPSSRSDRLLLAVVRSLALVAACVLLAIFLFLIMETLPALRNLGIGSFFRPGSWNPLEGKFNMVPMLVGSLLVTFLAIAIAAPFGALWAIFLHFYARGRAVGWLRRSVELLAGIPSVVYGFWGMTVLVPLINSYHPPGASLLAGALIVAFMVLPTIAMMADAAFAAVPRAYLEGAHALGLETLGILRTAVLPAAKSGLLTAVALATGRAVGETMAVIMVCGNIVEIPSSVFDPVRTLTANIALEMAYALGDHRSALFASGLILVSFISLLVLVVDLFAKEPSHDY